MANNYTDIDDLKLKANNAEAAQEIESDGVPSNEYLSAEQWNTVVTAVKELQDADPKAAVKKVKFNGTDYLPDEDGKVSFDQSGETTIFSLRLSLGEVSALQKDVNVTIPVKITFQQKAPLQETENLDRNITVHILTRANSEASLVERGTATIMSNRNDFVNVDISPYLAAGDNWVTLRATATVTNDYGVDVELQSTQEVTLKVVNLALIPDIMYAQPFTGGTATLRYAVTGAIDKYLQIEVYADREYSRLQYSYTTEGNGMGIFMGENTVYPGGTDFTFTSSEILGSVLLTSGHHYIKARLYATSTILTDWIESEIVANPSEPSVVVNNVANDLANWSDVTFFSWASMSNQTVVFRLTSSSDPTSVSAIEYASWQFSAMANVENIFRTQLGIMLENTALTEFDAYMHIEDENGNPLSDSIFFEIRNSADFAPISGAEFVLQPSTRSNSEAQPQTIINAADGSIVGSVWEGFDMTTDGYMDVYKNVDDTSVNADKLRALHIPAGRRLTILWNPLQRFINASGAENALAGKSMTLEIDFRTSNITDEEEPVIRLATEGTGDDIYGFEMKATEAALLTKDKRTRDDQNVSWAEDKRTRLTANIRYNINPDNNVNGTKLNYIRIFINETIEREFNYNNNDSFLGEDVNMVLGADNCDLDIFGIRCYQKDLSTNDVMQDYKAGLSSTAEKLAFQQANDILGGDGAIDYQKAIEAGYNVLGYTGHLPNYKDDAAAGNKGLTTGSSLHVHIHNEKKRCGTYTNLETSGQGTTAMTYDDWNQAHKVTDDTAFIPDYEEGTAIASKAKFDLADGEPKIKKACGKINFASSMQGHKMGYTRAFTDLAKLLMANGQLSTPGQISLQPNARLAVYERPFLFFHRETENDPWTFRYLMTWGAGKGDKPTFGFNEETTPNMMMVEGADNDKPVAQFMAPWNNDVTYDTGKEAWYYGGEKNINFGFGVTENKIPSATPVGILQGFFNFCYLHTQNIDYYSGSLEDLMADSSKRKFTSRLLWVTLASQSANRYDLFRWDVAGESWVPAGVNKETLNLRTQYESFCAEAGISVMAWDTNERANSFAKSARVSHFARYADNRIHVDDALYKLCLTKLFGGTDNRTKNCYYYVDPVTGKIRHEEDDTDTILKSNNLGQNRKPYYVEEFDKNSDGEYYWQGAENSYYCLLELAFPEEERRMMAYILAGMAILGGGTVMGFMEAYMLQAQNYFPGIAYNEMARLVYERAAIDQKDGTYVNNAANAITQSNGTQKWSEYQWLKDRIMYISSWCEYGEFSGSSGAGGGLGWRGAEGSYTFTLTPAKWLYPRVSQGDSNVGAMSNAVRSVRVRAGETFTYATITNSTDSVITIKGINYYLKIGDMNVPTSASQQTEFTFYGKKLQEVVINPNGSNANKFVAKTISIANATNIKRFIVRNVNTLDGNVDLSKCNRLQEIDMRGCTPSSITPPASSALTTMQLPASLTSLVLRDMPSLETLTMEGYDSLASVNIKQETMGNFNSMGLVNVLREHNIPINSLTLSGLAWTNARTELLDWMVGIATSRVTGTINVYVLDTVSFDEKINYVNKWGNIDDEENALYIAYRHQALSTFQIGGLTYIDAFGYYQYKIVTSNEGTGNDVVAIEWDYGPTQTDGHDDYINIDDYIGGISDSGVLHVMGLSDDKDCVISCTMTKNDGSTIRKTYLVGLHAHPRTIGDYVYSDGSWSDRLNPSLTHIGKCVDLIDSTHGICKPIGAHLNIYQWGLTSNSTTGVENVVLQNDPNYNVYDTPIQNTGTARNEAMMQLPEDIFGMAAGELVATGMYLNLLVLRHRNKIMTDPAIGLGEYVPETYKAVQLTTYGRSLTYLQAFQECRLALLALATDLGITDKRKKYAYMEFLFPMFTYCNCFEPSINVGETLAAHLSKGHWFLPLAKTIKNAYDNRNSWADNDYQTSGTSTQSCEELSATHAIAVQNGTMYTTANSFTGKSDFLGTNEPMTTSRLCFPVCVF